MGRRAEHPARIADRDADAPTPEHFREAMSRLGAAVNVITTAGPAGRHGFTASAVCSVTDRPPTLLVCMNRDNGSHDAFIENGLLCVNVLTDAHELLSGAFANRELDMDARFAHADWTQGAENLPRLSDAHASFDCRISEIHKVGTHSVLLCEVLDLQVGQDGPHALMWLARGYRRVPTS